MNWSDEPRIAPHLEQFCDVLFLHLQELAERDGVPVPRNRVPFTEIPLQAAGARFQEAVAECLGLILPAAPSGERLEEPKVFEERVFGAVGAPSVPDAIRSSSPIMASADREDIDRLIAALKPLLSLAMFIQIATTLPPDRARNMAYACKEASDAISQAENRRLAPLIYEDRPIFLKRTTAPIAGEGKPTLCKCETCGHEFSLQADIRQCPNCDAGVECWAFFEIRQ